MKVSLDPAEVVQVAISTKVLNTLIYGGCILATHRWHPLLQLESKYALRHKVPPLLWHWGQTAYNKTTQFFIASPRYRQAALWCRLNPDTTVHTLAKATLLYKAALPVILPVTFGASLLMFGKNVHVST